eukprot:719580-Amphidinium_carterae.2
MYLRLAHQHYTVKDTRDTWENEGDGSSFYPFREVTGPSSLRELRDLRSYLTARGAIHCDHAPAYKIREDPIGRPTGNRSGREATRQEDRSFGTLKRSKMDTSWGASSKDGLIVTVDEDEELPDTPTLSNHSFDSTGEPPVPLRTEFWKWDTAEASSSPLPKGTANGQLVDVLLPPLSPASSSSTDSEDLFVIDRKEFNQEVLFHAPLVTQSMYGIEFEVQLCLAPGDEGNQQLPLFGGLEGSMTKITLETANSLIKLSRRNGHVDHSSWLQFFILKATGGSSTTGRT